MQQAKRKYTLADIEALPEDVRAELINGELYMQAVPTTEHQEVISNLHIDIGNYIRSKGGQCKVFESPFAVYLNDDSGKENYLIPDLSVICDISKISKYGCNGAPNWIIEVTSPSTRKNDFTRKMILYMQAGVREYWIVDLQKRKVIVYSANQDDFDIALYPFGERIPVGIYPDLYLTI